MIHYTYILASKQNGTLYVGMTTNLLTRVSQHKSGNIKGFTSKYKVYMQVYFETHNNRKDAFARERQLKNWKRSWKLDLIESLNPDWNDLYNKLEGS